VAGIYIHIPFCSRKCNYCNFFSLATTKFRDEFFQALPKEIELTRDYLAGETMETIYFGGGTPSLFRVKQLEEIIQQIPDEGRGMRDEGQGTRDEGRGMRDEGRGTRDEGRGTRDEGRGTRDEGRGTRDKGRGTKDEGRGFPSFERRGVMSEASDGVVHSKAETDRKKPKAHREITLEMNPEDVTPEYLSELDASAINRVSLGVQSFFDEDLEYLGRNHSAEQAGKALEMILDEGRRTRDERRGFPSFDRRGGTIEVNDGVVLSVDLIYGIPTLTNDQWKENLNRVINLGIPHISAYALTVEPKTPLAWMINKAQGTGHRAQNSGDLVYKPVSEDQIVEQFGILMDVMEQAGYVHYEISNFCLPGYESRHNSNYWKGIPYLGLGPSAHSFNGSSRWWNIPHLTSYIQHLKNNILPFEEETLTTTQRYNEYVMTSLRTIWGCDIDKIEEEFGAGHASHFRNLAIRHLESGHLSESNGIYALSRSGKFLADGIAAELFL